MISQMSPSCWSGLDSSQSFNRVQRRTHGRAAHGGRADGKTGADQHQMTGSSSEPGGEPRGAEVNQNLRANKRNSTAGWWPNARRWSM
jgi:hypothetical protein